MYRLVTVTALAFLGLAFLSAPAMAQKAAPVAGWESIGPSGGDIADIVASPGNASRLYALIGGDGPGQIFTSADAGQSWTRLAAGFAQPVYSLAVDPSNPAVLYVLGAYGVNKTTDGGTIWTRTDFGGYFYGGDGEIAVHPLDPNLIMATGYYRDGTSQESRIAFYRSTDAGVTWSRVPVSPATSDARGLSLAVDPSNLNTVYVAGFEADNTGTAAGRVYKSVDGGASWVGLMGPLTADRVESIILDPGNPARVFASTLWFVFRSSDGGQSWSRNQGQALGHDLILDPVDANTLYAGWNRSVYKSSDGGVNWALRPTGQTGICRSLLAANGQIFYGSDLGLFRSGDAGATWMSSQAGLNATRIRSFAISPLGPNLIYAAVGSSIFKSTNFGETWSAPPFTFDDGTPIEIAFDAADPTVGYALVNYCSG